ncbi:hypothetical protein CAMRE0001_2067 [Campylobacter rectus RM3267]|uniref:Uncharacterized protein n=1 Tax=Campylobacter rectus RM3267 TaxID=553218 RepID=B9D4L2_CAMRE|nr:hypothetical protein CAMRE0001_2067 [Campylobacter rectus RM3267]
MYWILLFLKHKFDDILSLVSFAVFLYFGFYRVFLLFIAPAAVLIFTFK